MTELHTYRLTPRAPLVFRSGKPFLAGTRDNAQFPWPSAWAGLLRTRYMDQHGLGPDDRERLVALRTAGALLAYRRGSHCELYVPKPADALALKDEESFLPLRPLSAAAGTGCDLPAGLRPVGLVGSKKGKPHIPALYWTLSRFLAWARGESVKASDESPRQPVEEMRTHVSIKNHTGAADPGRLFQTTGLDFAMQDWQKGTASGEWVFVGQGPANLPPGLVVFGGERRLSRLDREDPTVWHLPPQLQIALTKARGIAVTLATPAIFANGWCPAWIGATLEGRWPGTALTLRLQAAAIDRWQPISGWDLQAGRAKPMRRAVAAGATYWLEIIDGELDPAALWLHSMSDAQQDRLDGFGLALLRPWNPDI